MPKQITNATIKQILIMKSKGEKHKDICTKFKISAPTIKNIINKPENLKVIQKLTNNNKATEHIEQTTFLSKKIKQELVKTGRPNIIDKDVLKILEICFSMGCTDREACLQAKICPATLYNYQKGNEAFLDRKKTLKTKMIFKARSVLAWALNKKDVKVMMWYLERTCPEEFGGQSKKETEPIEKVFDLVLTKEEKDEFYIAIKNGI